MGEDVQKCTFRSASWKRIKALSARFGAFGSFFLRFFFLLPSSLSFSFLRFLAAGLGNMVSFFFLSFLAGLSSCNQHMIRALFTTRTPAFILLDRSVKAIRNERTHTHTTAQTLVWGFPDCYASMKSIMHMRKELKKLELGKMDETAECCTSGREPHL